MNLSRKLICILILALALGAVSVCAAEASPEHTRSNGSPYYLMVNRQMNTLTVYALGEDGMYSVPERVMICSTGRKGHPTPLGTFTLSTYKSLWTHMIDDSYGQYVSQFKGDYLIHSVCYREKDPSTLMTEEYNQLGTSVSRGCVRLQVGDAKWVFDNCPAGTRVTIFDSPDPGPLGKPDRMVNSISDELDNGWDPTDPRENNPWHERLAQTLGLLEPKLVAEAEGQADYTLNAPAEENSGKEEPFAVVAVSIPRVRPTGEEAVSAQKAAEQDTREPSAPVAPEQASQEPAAPATREEAASAGSSLPFSDVEPEQWYYSDIRYICERKLFAFSGSDRFAPDAPVTASLALQMLCRLSETGAAEPAVSEQSAYDWALSLGMGEVLPEGVIAPEHALSRQEFAQILHFLEETYGANVDSLTVSLSQYVDNGRISTAAREAVAWAVQQGLLRGAADQRLLPEELLTRAQLAAILHRYDLIGSAVA